jgi:sortase (surface protein transpeptidase)
MNFNNNFTKPILIEPGVKYFFNETLKNVHSFKENYYNVFFNITLLVLFFFILALLLLYKYKGKLTNEELEQKETEKKYYILSKIKNYQDAKLKSQQQLITGLPKWETEYDIVNNKLYH